MMHSHPLTRAGLFGALLFGVALLPAQAQYLLVEKPQGDLGRELSNPFPVSNDLITMSSLMNPDGTPYVGALPTQFTGFRLEVSVLATDTRTTAGSSIPGSENDDLNSIYATLSFGGTTEERTDTSGRLLNYNFNNSSFDFGTADFASTPVVNAMSPLVAEGSISNSQSDDLVSILTGSGFRPYVGPHTGNGTARFYTYDTSANYRLLLFTTTSSVPEPGMAALLGASLIGGGVFLRRRR